MIPPKHITKVYSRLGKSSISVQKCRLPRMSVTGRNAGVDQSQLLSNSAVVQHGGRGNAWPMRVLSAAVGCAMFACLPVGTPPVGQHVIADRTLTGVYLSPSEQDGVPSHLLVTGPQRGFPPGTGWTGYSFATEATLSDLYVVPYVSISNPADGLAGWQPLVGDFLISYLSLTNGTIPTDGPGRLVFVQYLASADSLQVARVDIATRATDPLGYPNLRSNGQFFALSPARTRVYSGSYENGNLCDLDACRALDYVSIDAALIYANPNNFAFVGEDFYYVDQLSGASAVLGGSLHRIKPQAAPDVLLSYTGMLSFQPILGDSTPQLLLSLQTDSGVAPFALLDTDTLKTSSFPSDKGQAQFVSASTDGHWLAFLSTVAVADPTQPADHRLFLYDWTTGGYAVVDSARAGQIIGTYLEWRPGSTELWFSAASDGFGIWRPDAGLTTVHANLNPYVRAPDGESSVFTRDGRHWFSAGPGTTTLTIYVGSSDNPTAPVQALNPYGTVTTSHWETDDGRLLVGAWTIDGNRKDVYLVDADAGTSRAILSAGHLVALGHTRALALLNWETSRESGDLTLIDLASGAQTLLAENVHDVAVDRGKSASVPPGTDALAPGTRVAFLTNNRLASPWDGLWVATLP
jgi:hypothetical protein